MGEGNYRTDRGRTCHVHGDGDDEFLWEDLHTDALICAPQSFDFCDVWHPHERNCKIVARNAHHAVWLYANSHGIVYVTYGMNPDVSDTVQPLAVATLDKKSEKFFDALQESYPGLAVATSPWTSATRGAKTAGVA